MKKDFVYSLSADVTNMPLKERYIEDKYLISTNYHVSFYSIVDYIILNYNEIIVVNLFLY